MVDVGTSLLLPENDEWPADTTVQLNANISIVYTLPSVIHHFSRLGCVIITDPANEKVEAAEVSKCIANDHRRKLMLLLHFVTELKKQDIMDYHSLTHYCLS